IVLKSNVIQKRIELIATRWNMLFSMLRPSPLPKVSWLTFWFVASFVLLIGLSQPGSASVSPTWTLPFEIKGNNTIFTRTIGGDQNATNGFDASLDIAAPPVGMTYYGYLQLAEFPTYLDTDIRPWSAPYSTEIIWTLQVVNAAQINTELKWTPTNLPAVGKFQLEGLDTPLDLRANNTVTFTGNKTLTIHYMPQASAEWRVPITITLENWNYTRTFGGAPTATAGFDPNLDQVAAPPGMEYYAYFALETFPNYLETDLRGWIAPYESDITWTLQILKSNNKASLLSWNSNLLPPEGQFKLSGGDGEVDMRSQSTVTIQGDRTLLIQYTKQGLKGDVNLDGARDILDLQFIIAFINQTKTPSATQFWAADCNHDQALNILDIVRLIRWINGLPMTTEKPGLISATASTSLQWDAFQVRGPNQGEFAIHLRPAQPIAGVQLELEITPLAKILTPRFEPPLEGVEIYGVQQAGRFRWISHAFTGQTFSQPVTLILPVQLLTSGSTLPRLEVKQVMLASPTATALPVAVLAPTSDLMATPVLDPAYPNPFNPATTIGYRLPQTMHVDLRIFDLLGREVKTLVKQEQLAGEHQVTWDGADHAGAAVGSGIYWARLRSGNTQRLQKLLLIQ
ncbi:dockerin type I domain-containing protein, partial [candidate division KSB1 bacterium]|nr:dockerin type I domain-containing protein [candidate division KSB1 bacterium]